MSAPNCSNTTSLPNDDLAKLAYEAYSTSAPDGSNPIGGNSRVWSAWDDLPNWTRQIFRNVAQVVRNATIQSFGRDDSLAQDAAAYVAEVLRDNGISYPTSYKLRPLFQEAYIAGARRNKQAKGEESEVQRLRRAVAQLNNFIDSKGLMKGYESL